MQAIKETHQIRLKIPAYFIGRAQFGNQDNFNFSLNGFKAKLGLAHGFFQTDQITIFKTFSNPLTKFGRGKAPPYENKYRRKQYIYTHFRRIYQPVLLHRPFSIVLQKPRKKHKLPTV